MRLDTTKIDDRIRKLQELKRIASDPEMVGMLSEFLDLNEEAPAHFAAAAGAVGGEGNPVPAQSPSDEAGDLINHVVQSVPGRWGLKR
jgi:hypothetical protein